MPDIRLDYISDSSLEEVVFANDSVTVVPPNDPHPELTNDATRSLAAGLIGVPDSQVETRLKALADSAAEPAPSTGPDDPTPTPFHRPLPPKYQFVRTLGRGGMGEVILARDTILRRDVALKFMLQKAAHSPFARMRFEREARVLAKLKHPNVVSVHEYGEFEGEPYFAMAYLDGLSLHERRGEYRVSAGRAVGVMARIAAGLHHAHENGVFHRDLKASNVMFSDGHPVITDFGCAKIDDGEQSTQGYALLGTLSHMAPEVFEHGSKEYDARGDVFSLGVMLFRLLAGEGPFGDDPPPGFPRNRARTEDPPAIRDCIDAVPGVDARLEAIVRKALANTPADRYPTAAAFADDLDRWQAGAEVEATTVTAEAATSTPTRTGRVREIFSRRRWLAVVSGLGVTGLTGAGIWGATRIGTERPAGDDDAGELHLAERLTEGETVTLIGRTRLPTIPWVRVNGITEGSLDQRLDGYCAVAAARLTMFELGTLAVPFDVTLSAEVSHITENAGSRVGIYALRKEHPQQLGANHAAAVNWYNGSAAGGGRPSNAELALYWIAPREPSGDFVLTAKGPRQLEVKRQTAGTPDDDPEFRRLTLRFSPTLVGGTHAGVEIERPIAVADSFPVYRQYARERNEQLIGTAVPGEGFGLIVTSGVMVVRNMTIARSS